MSMRFIGLLPRRDDRGKAARQTLRQALPRARFRQVIDAPQGLLLLAERTLMRALSRDGRLLLGPAFDEQGQPARAEDLVGADADQLLSRYWGPCIAIAPTPGPGGATYSRFTLARDPSGGLACYVALTSAGLYFASDLSLALQAGLPPPAIDWSMLTADIVYRRARGVRTCLTGLTELAPGQAATVGAETFEVQLSWDPWRDGGPARGQDSRDAAAQALQSRIDLCTSTLSRLFERPVLELSGGLDSSIVAAALGPRPGLTAIHCISPGPEGDERLYARAVASRFELPLSEHLLAIGRFDPARVTEPHLPRPGRPGVLGAAHRLVRNHCRARGADGVFTGAGGDSVFCSLNTPAPVADRFWAQGPGLGFLRSLGDLSRRHNVPIWSAARMTARSIRRTYDPMRGAVTQFLKAEAVPPGPDLHPWMAAAPERAPLGRSLHIASIAFILGYMEGQARSASTPTIAPLLSRPVLEACLSQPTWRWIEGGRDRALARLAYRDRLPARVIERRSKGGIDHYVTGLFERNADAVRELLLDGLLGQAGILNRPLVEAAFGTPARRAVHAHRLLELADAEAWARNWTRANPGA
jgi:asparagine synthase (glutamine-hydrolysing)